MDEELLKRYTDCVYFLASPLTCKKGIDCEYRHCEMARLNPRDCWYWLAGSCLNLACAFRHPPLDGLTAAISEPAPCTEPVNKTSFPCYFYFNGYCNKGEKCCFLHSIEADALPVGNSIKPSIANSVVPQAENNTFSGSDSVSAPNNKHVNPSATVKASVDTEVQTDEDFKLAELEDVQQQNSSPQISVSDCEETAKIRSDSLIPAGGSAQSVSCESKEHSSGEQVDDQIGSERWESSPGFDVLVDDESENLDCEDDHEFILGLDRGRKELNSHFLGYQFEKSVEYDSKYHDAELHYEGEMYNPYNRQVNEHIFDDMRNIPGNAKVKTLDSILCRKRKLIPVELDYDNHREVDLRDQLRRRRFIDSHSVTTLSRMQESSHPIGRRYDGPRWHGMGHRQLRGSLASEVRRNAIESLSNDENYRNGGRPRGLPRHSKQFRSRKHYKEKRPTKRKFISSEVSRKMAQRERRSAQKSSTFTGPKTLSQIKEEKRKTEENGNFIGETEHCSRKRSTDFQGPRPFSEILEEKRKLTCETTGSI
ncbi:Zinc finger, CCCH-type [Parasponia andersonii]|uniref:Zinc finger, CCCH-type n=1 Tax=Parasponia andersonii TaxID=3476 RepID=A0A2P5DYS9_PARAD|nr:Zinc finger, CCCH-type [Parasponia andersonii]